ncbi:MAG: serine/threonine protein kinase [Planctomycetes bacterium]|nr:serine/threonine protein kinase [Planctomycetota bacterium]
MVENSPLTLSCPRCGASYQLRDHDPKQRYRCRSCSGVLASSTPTADANAVSGAVASSSFDEPLPDEVYQAQKDPENRIGRFLRVRVLGSGAKGVVHKAWDLDLGRWVAIKLLLGDDDSPEERARFRREAQLAARLDHPNIAPVYEVGEHLGARYIVMKFIEGATLDVAPLPDARAQVACVRDACRGVGYAHERGTVHRDLKPKNLLVDPEGRVYVTDFGLAKSLGAKGMDLTNADALLGTPAYMAPEQARGGVKEIDTRTDVYALGATLWTILAGRYPHNGETPLQILLKIILGPSPPIRGARPDLPEALERVLLRAMSHQKEGRQRTADVLAAELTELLDRPIWAGLAAGKFGAPAPLAAVSSTAVPQVPSAGVEPQVEAAMDDLVEPIVEPIVEPLPDLDLGMAGRGAGAPGLSDATHAVPGPVVRPSDSGRIESLESGVRAAQKRAGTVEAPSPLSAPVSMRPAAAGTDVDRLVRGCIEEGRRHLAARSWQEARFAFAKALASRPGEAFAQAGMAEALERMARDPAGLQEAGSLDQEGDAVRCVAFSPSGKLLAVGGARSLRLWDVARRALVVRCKGQVGGVVEAAFDPGQPALIAAVEGHCQTWDLRSGHSTRTFACGGGGGSALALSPDGRFLAAGDADGRIEVWDAATARVLRTLGTGRGAVIALAFGPAGRLLAFATLRGELGLLPCDPQGEAAPLPGRSGLLAALAFNREGTSLATAGADRAVRVLELAGRREVATLAGHEGQVGAVGYSPDGETLASGGRDHLVRLWDLGRGREVRSLGGHEGAINCVAFSPDGKLLVSGGAEGVVRCWSAR